MGKEPLNEIQRSIKCWSVSVLTTWMFNTGVITGSRKMNVCVNVISRLDSLTQSTNIDRTPILFPTVVPKMNETCLETSRSWQPIKKDRWCVVSSTPCGTSPVLRMPEGGGCLYASRNQSPNLPFIRSHALVIIENEYNFIKDLVQSVKFGGAFIPNLSKTTVVFFLNQRNLKISSFLTIFLFIDFGCTIIFYFLPQTGSNPDK